MSESDEFEDPWERVVDEERTRGFLTKRDRSYLQNLVGQSSSLELGEQAERDLRYRIRSRVENGLLDVLLLDYYPDEELAKIFEEEYTLMSFLIVYLFQLAYRIHLVFRDGHGFDSADEADAHFADMLEHAIERERLGPDVVNADVTIFVNREDFDEDRMINKIVAGNATGSDLWTYVEKGDNEKLYRALEAAGRDINLIDGGDFDRDMLLEVRQYLGNTKEE